MQAMQCSLQAIVLEHEITSWVDWACYGRRMQRQQMAADAVASADWRNCRWSVAERQQVQEQAGPKAKAQSGRRFPI